MARNDNDFLGGVIEGFYGAPWTPEERLELFSQMSDWGLNTYMYSPKDDLKHRTLWRETYDPTEAAALGHLIQACHAKGLHFFYGIGPGLDIRYSDPSEITCLQQRLEQLHKLGCRNFALLFDDIPDGLSAADLTQWGSLAGAQSHVANTVCRWMQEREAKARFLFCPTPYCERMVQQGLGGKGYLETLGRTLASEIDVFWTGPEIISREIPLAGIEQLREVLRRPPVIWDNLHANDYDGRRFFCGPYSGRPQELRGATRGILSNPNNEFPLNYVPLRTLGMYLQGPGEYDPRTAYLEAMGAWHGQFACAGEAVALEDLVLLGDCYYLPHEEGPNARALLAVLEILWTHEPSQWGEEAQAFLETSKRLRRICGQMSGVRRRSLFNALCRRLWDLREELDLLEGFVRFRREHPHAQAFRSGSHLPGTWRGGMVARLQQLLEPQVDGTFRAARVRAVQARSAATL